MWNKCCLLYTSQGTGTGSAIHVYNEDGEEVLTYTGGVGWQEKETKAESQVHSALKMTYYEAFSEARKALNSEEKAGSINAVSYTHLILRGSSSVQKDMRYCLQCIQIQHIHMCIFW